MNISATKKTNIKELFQLISTIISWTIFVLLIMCACFLLYYFIATKLYAAKGDKYEPKYSLYTIISPSMTPNINVYDIIVDKRVDSPEEIQIGDVITFISTSNEHIGKTVTHRVISVIKDKGGNVSYQTKGDYSPIEDSGSVPFNNVIGKVALRLPQLGRIQMLASRKMGWLFIILIPALYIIFKDALKKLMKEFKKDRNNKLSKVLNMKIYQPKKKLVSKDEKNIDKYRI